MLKKLGEGMGDRKNLEKPNCSLKFRSCRKVLEPVYLLEFMSGACLGISNAGTIELWNSELLVSFTVWIPHWEFYIQVWCLKTVGNFSKETGP